MSLINQAVVHIAANCLADQTWAVDRVFPQPVDPIGEVLRSSSEKQRPVVAVYVDSAEFDVEGHQTQGSSSNIELKVFVYVAPGRVQLPDDVTQFKLDTTTAGLTLNLMARQVDQALFHHESTWNDVWRKFCSKVTRRTIRYMLVEVEDAVRIPTMEITYSIVASPDPNYGSPLKPGWVMLDEILRTSAEGAVLADLFKGMIEGPGGIPDYQILQTNFGLSDAALASTGLAPFDPASVDPDTGNTPLLEEVTVIGDVVVGPVDDEDTD